MVTIRRDRKKCGVRFLCGKRGATLVELIAAVLILAVVVLAVFTGITAAQNSIYANSAQSKAAAQAQSMADTLMDLVKKDGVAAQLSGTAYPAGDTKKTTDASVTFPQTNGKKYQYRITRASTDEYLYHFEGKNPSDPKKTISAEASANLELYKIEVAVTYPGTTATSCVQLTAYAAKTA